MSAKQLIVISILVIVIIVAFYFAFFRNKETPVVRNVADNGTGLVAIIKPGPAATNVVVKPSDITGGSTTINKTGDSVYAKANGVKVYSIYDNTVRKTAAKDEWIGTYNGSWASGNATALNTTAGKSWVSNGNWYIKS